MGWLQIIGAFLTLAIRIFDLWREHNTEKAAKKKEDLKDALDAIEKNDASALTRALGRLR